MSIGDVGSESSKAKKPTDFTSKLIGFLVFVAVSFGVRFVVGNGAAEVEIRAKNMSGHGWDDAKPELEKRYRATLAQAFPGLTEVAIQGYVSCMHDSYLPWLNQSGCYYLYNKNTTSMSEHLRAQDECLLSKGGLKISEEFDLLCSARNFPNNWSIFIASFAATFYDSYRKPFEEVGLKADREIPECAAKKYAAYLNTTDCRPLNPHAKVAGEVMSSCADRVESAPGYDEKVERMWEECATAH